MQLILSLACNDPHLVISILNVGDEGIYVVVDCLCHNYDISYGTWEKFGPQYIALPHPNIELGASQVM